MPGVLGSFEAKGCTWRLRRSVRRPSTLLHLAAALGGCTWRLRRSERRPRTLLHLAVALRGWPLFVSSLKI